LLGPRRRHLRRPRGLAEPLGPELGALINGVAGAETAPVEIRTLHQRVHEGRTSWQAFWAVPQQEPGGLALFWAVLAAQLSAARTS